MPPTLPEPGFSELARGGVTDSVIAFLGDLPNKFDTLGQSASYLNLIYFLWALTVILAGFVVYLAIRMHDLEHREKEGYYHEYGKDTTGHPDSRKKTRAWEGIVSALKSENISDWKIAVLEADSLLARLMENLGYEGENLGERLKNVPKSDMKNLEDAWTAHKFRNAIAHEGANLHITRQEFAEVIARFERVFREFDYI